MRKTLILIALIFSVITFSCENPSTPFDETVPIIFTLTTEVTPDEGGEIIPSSGEFTANTQIEIEARPSEGWFFNGWEGDLVSSRNPVTVLIDSDKFITARFLESEFNLNIEVTGNGRVIMEEMAEKSKKINASSSNKTNHINLVTDSMREKLNMSLLSVETENREPENIESLDGSLVTANSTLQQNRTVRLTAEPADGWEFVRWEGDLSGNENPAIIEVDRNKTIVAVFEQQGIVAFSLTVGIQGEGTVELDPDKETYEEGEEVTLTAEPAEGWAFLEWQEDLTGTDNPAMLVMASDKSVTAVFESLASNPSTNIIVQPTSTTAGEVISPAPTVEITGPEGNPLGGIEVTVSEQGGFDFDSGTLTVTTRTNGMAEFDDLVINRAGSYRLVFAVDGAGQVTSDRFNVNSANGEPSQTVADVPENGTAGEPSEITITIEDSFGNRVEGEAGDLSVSVSGVNDINSVTPIRDDGNGIYSASYTPKRAGSDQISIQLNGISVTGSPFSSMVVPGPAAIFNFNTISSPQTAGESFSITITALDTQGNEATGFSETADLSTTAGMITPESISFINGTATSSVSVTKAGARQTITVSAGTLNGTSGQFTLEAGPPGIISVVTQPELSEAGQPISGPPTTKVTDLFDNPIVGAEVSVSESGGATFDNGSLRLTTGNQGRAVFNDLIINLAGSYSLLFKTSELDVTSSTFEIESSDGDPSKTTAIVPSFGNEDKPTRITITVEDSFGNRVERAAGDLSVSVSGANDIDSVTPIRDDGNGVYSTSYTPKNIGSDRIRIQLNGIDISESPFRSVVLFSDLNN